LISDFYQFTKEYIHKREEKKRRTEPEASKREFREFNRDPKRR